MREDYPLYVKWRYITGYMLDICSKYPKNVRFNLANRITNISLDILEGVVSAIYDKTKREILIQLNLKLEILRALLHISVDRHYISVNQYAHISEEVDQAGKMVGGWLKSCKE